MDLNLDIFYTPLSSTHPYPPHTHLHGHSKCHGHLLVLGHRGVGRGGRRRRRVLLRLPLGAHGVRHHSRAGVRGSVIHEGNEVFNQLLRADETGPESEWCGSRGIGFKTCGSDAAACSCWIGWHLVIMCGHTRGLADSCQPLENIDNGKAGEP